MADKRQTSGESSSGDSAEGHITPLVGIVASAGGLAALKDFFHAMPADSGMAFLLVPHLDPNHESLMVTLLARQTDMPVVEAGDGQRVEPDHIYIIPPGHELTLRDGVIRLGALTGRAAGKTPIEPFLLSLAEDQQENAICIILSGTGSHGTLGLKSIKANGGMAMVQEPATAEYDRMPRSAIETGLADYILPPGHMPEALLGYVRHFVAGTTAVPEPALVQDDLTRVLALLNARTRFDFRVYRKGMLLRRIQRRMGLNHLDQLADYLDLLCEQPEELDRLGSDLLISVTAFFRDPEMFGFLEVRVLPDLLEGRDRDTPGAGVGARMCHGGRGLLHRHAADRAYRCHGHRTVRYRCSQPTLTSIRLKLHDTASTRRPSWRIWGSSGGSVSSARSVPMITGR